MVTTMLRPVHSRSREDRSPQSMSLSQRCTGTETGGDDDDADDDAVDDFSHERRKKHAFAPSTPTSLWTHTHVLFVLLILLAGGGAPPPWAPSSSFDCSQRHRSCDNIILSHYFAQQLGGMRLATAYHPTPEPSVAPTREPTVFPTSQPSNSPSGQPSYAPTSPSGQPTCEPTCYPSVQPTGSPSCPSSQPSSTPSCPSGQVRWRCDGGPSAWTTHISHISLP